MLKNALFYFYILIIMTEENNAKNINLLVNFPLISIGQVTQNIQNFKGVLKYDRSIKLRCSKRC